MSKIRVLFIALAVLGLLAVPCGAQTQEDCIQATAKIRADDGSTGTGTLYGFGDHRGKRVALFATAAHVAETQYATVWVGRRQTEVKGVVIWKRRDVDAATIAVRIEWFGKRIPHAVPLWKSRARLRVGRPIFSIGHPGGGPALYWKGTVNGYHQDGSILFRPGPEMGRSGSALFITEGGKSSIVGIISARNESRLTGNTVGRAVSIGHLQSRQWKATSAGWFDVQCQDGQCPVPAPGNSSRRYYSPYREGVDRRLQGIERSQGTAPLPPPPVDLSPIPPDPKVLAPLERRLAALEGRVDAQGEGIKAVDGRVERIVEGFEGVKERLSGRYPELIKAYDEVRKATIAAQGQAEAAVELAGGADGKADAATKAAETAGGDAAEVKEILEDESETGFIGRRIAKVKERLSATFIGKIATARGWSFAAIGTTGFFGIGLGVVVLYLFLRREGSKAAAGEKTLGQRFAERTSNPVDDMFFDWLAGKQGAVHEGMDTYSPARRLRKRVVERFKPEEVDEVMAEEEEYVPAAREKLYRRDGKRFVQV